MQGCYRYEWQQRGVLIIALKKKSQNLVPQATAEQRDEYTDWPAGKTCCRRSGMVLIAVSLSLGSFCAISVWDLVGQARMAKVDQHTDCLAGKPSGERSGLTFMAESVALCDSCTISVRT